MSSDGVIRPGETDERRAFGLGGVEDPFGRDHDAEVDHLVVVAAEHDADDVLADVVHVALDGREHDPRLRLPLAVLLVLHERLEVRDCTLHHARGLDDLRQEHAARAEQVADDAHAVHQRPLDHVERPRELCARLLGVRLDEVDDAVHERVLEPLSDRGFAPPEVELALRSFAAHPIGDLDQPLRRVGPPVEDHVLDALEQLGVDVLVDGELAGVDDPHVEAGADRVEEEDGVHRLADRRRCRGTRS